MEPFDYYVSGVKIDHQVPRIQAHMVDCGVIKPFNLNDSLESFEYTILVFYDQLLHHPSVLKASDDEAVDIIYISLEDSTFIQKMVDSKVKIVSDKTHQIAELYGVLDEHTHALYNSVFMIKNSGQLSVVLSGLPASFFEEHWPSRLSQYIK